jgi:hypothetical protein
MKNNIKILTLISVLVFIASCSEDFLQVPVYVNQSSETYFTNDENAIDAATAVYATIRADETYGVPSWLFGDSPSDDAESGGDLSGNDQPTKQEFDRLYYKPDNAELLNFWRGMYIGIFRANWLINGIADNTYITPATIRELTGEVRFIRAMMHFDLMKVFGGITIRDENATFTTSPVRASIAEVLHFVEEQLILAAEEMSPTPWRGEDGRATSGAAKALLVKVYVFESSYADLISQGKDPDNLFEGCTGKWNEARDLADEIINNKSLYGFDLDPDYYHIWRIAGERSSEHVFKIKGTRLAGHVHPNISMGANEWGAAGGSGTSISTWQGCRGIFITGPNGEKVDSVDTYDRGYGFNSPTQELVNSFNPLDPRLHASIVFNYLDSTIRTRDNVTKYYRMATWASPTGYCSNKYLLTEDEWAPTDLNVNSGSADIKVIRYADLLLWAAEAHMKAGSPNQAKAMEYINLIRKRARDSGKPVASAEPADLTSITLEDVYQERRNEMALEGHRFFDLVRLGKAYDAINGQFNNSIDATLVFEQRKMEFFPIPASELTASNNSLKQNPGY